MLSQSVVLLDFYKAQKHKASRFFDSNAVNFSFHFYVDNMK